MIGKSGERGSKISVLAARHDDDEYDIHFIDLFKFCNFVLYYKIILKEYLFLTILLISHQPTAIFLSIWTPFFGQKTFHFKEEETAFNDYLASKPFLSWKQKNLC